ncbi:hypothetical protein HD554DRAFT_2020628 [Boletus coccyginus]|nr:hypothetical protein HD554DRAFT_2020628 [Boletus coccyginus]
MRGTDINFPSGFGAAVTLDPKVTKDRCMRTPRKLGHGHSIMFFAPLEVDRRIRYVAGKGSNPSNVICVMNILQWAIRETCDEIQQRAPHWAQQGMVTIHPDMSFGPVSVKTSCPRKNYQTSGFSQEAKRLEDPYGARNPSNYALLATPSIRQRCLELGVSSVRSVNLDGEQEREVTRGSGT